MKLSIENIVELINDTSTALRASIYIPTNPHASKQDNTRLKNALQIIRNDSSYDDRELGDSMQKIYDDLIDNDEFWNYQDYGLAVFFDRDGYKYFHMPYEITEAEYLLDHYVVSPLALVASADTGFYVLDVNFTSPRLLNGARGVMQEIENTAMPKSFDQVIKRTAYKNHSLGGEDNALNEDEKKYLSLVARAFDEQAEYSGRALLLAGTSNRTGVIRGLIQHEHVLRDTLVGSYEKATTEKLYQDSVEVVKAVLRKERDSVVQTLDSTPPELVVSGTKEITEAAARGRVETTIMPVYRLTADSVRKAVDEALVIELPSDIHDVEETVRAALGQSGKIVAVEIGGYESLDEPKAICRY